MDAEVMRKLGGDPSTDDVALYNILSFVDYDIKSTPGMHLDTSICLMLECRPELKEMLRRALETQSYKQIRLLEYLWPPRAQKSERWLTVSFIRHAQSFGNVHGIHTPNADVLTPYGEKQARMLGVQWAKTRIDAVHCSTLNRAKRTALALGRGIHPVRWLVERNAPARPRRGEDLIEGHEFLSDGPHEDWRDEMPDGHGESFADVAARAVHYLLCLFSYHSVAVDKPPRVAGLRADRPEDVPEEIPHIVVVAHNFILCELYEALLGWNDDQHPATNADFEQTGWSRHVLCLKGSDRSAGGRGKLYGRLEQTILRHPSEYNPANCNVGESPQPSTAPHAFPKGVTPISMGMKLPMVAA
ncbi:phosphoglycerate mutase-like protein [Exidia glandulosa HHB12029]|uniref:Phosphoglycerate mutase-like protein n=1 Tax=Exidia glandulosa HHB12029 TaxID=1314781 RepID=A0A165KX01_EXIGL|nr:phosphoglycerate mutase-like protein [Exidia glandulosa HHB12029]